MTRTLRVAWMALALVAPIGCDGEPSMDPGFSGSGSASSGEAGETDEGGSSGAMPSSDVLASARFTIPAGTVVQEFDFSAEGEAGFEAGTPIVVAVRDVTHTDRDEATLCPGSHPLDGCATVDYGAFGSTHDNSITLEGEDGSFAIHLFKDRSLEPEAEPLPDSE
jgi:hypothetical protein